MCHIAADNQKHTVWYAKIIVHDNGYIQPGCHRLKQFRREPTEYELFFLLHAPHTEMGVRTVPHQSSKPGVCVCVCVYALE